MQQLRNMTLKQHVFVIVQKHKLKANFILYTECFRPNQFVYEERNNNNNNNTKQNKKKTHSNVMK